MKHDALSDVFSVIKNSESIGKSECTVPASKMIKRVLEIMHKRKYIGDVTFIDDGRSGTFKVKLSGKINDCNSVRPRFSIKVNEMRKFEKRFLPATDVGLLLISTPKGVLDHEEAKKEKTGGKLLGFVY